MTDVAVRWSTPAIIETTFGQAGLKTFTSRIHTIRTSLLTLRPYITGDVDDLH